MVKKRFLGVALLAVFIVVLSGCYARLSDTGDKKDIEPEVKIGAPISLTGNLSSYGQDIKEGAMMAIEEVNREGKLRIKIIFEDAQSELTPTVNAVNKLIDIDSVHIILGPDRSSNVLAAAPITEAKKVILFSPISSADEISEAGDYVFRNREKAGLSGERMADFLATKGISRVAVLSAQSANSVSYKNSFIKKFEELGRKIVYLVDYDPKSTDFKTDIMKAMNKKPEAIYISNTTGVDAGIIAKQIKELGFGGLVTGSNSLETKEFIKGAGEAASGVFLTSPAFDLTSPDVLNYRDRYKALYGRESNVYAANAYDAIKILVAAVTSCGGDTDTDCLRDFIYGVKDYPGIGGNTTFDRNGDVIKPVAIKVVRDGEFIFYEK